MKGKKIITILVIINILFIGIIYNLININYFKNNKQIVKHMTETGNESQIEELNKSYQNYREYIDASKKQLATAITNKGVTTTSDSTLEIMTANVNKIVTNPPASLISYDNTSSGLSASNVQGAVDQLDNSIDNINEKLIHNQLTYTWKNKDYYDWRFYLPSTTITNGMAFMSFRLQSNNEREFKNNTWYEVMQLSVKPYNNVYGVCNTCIPNNDTHVEFSSYIDTNGILYIAPNRDVTNICITADIIFVFKIV